MRVASVGIHGKIIWNFGGTSKRGKDAYLKNLNHISNHDKKDSGRWLVDLRIIVRISKSTKPH